MEIEILEYSFKQLVFPFVVKKLHAGIQAHYDIHIVFLKSKTTFVDAKFLRIGNERYEIKNLAAERDAKGDFSKEEGLEEHPRWIKIRCLFLPEPGNIYQQKIAEK